MPESIRAIVSGRVQGVGYRAWTATMANKLGLKGWVRNCSDGTVEAVFHGEKSAIDAMLEACRTGPVLARVDDIKSSVYEEVLEETARFVSKPTL